MSQLGPECQQGKHDNCDGVADLDDDDQPVVCVCIRHTDPDAPTCRATP